jgi:hypothetical protein
MAKTVDTQSGGETLRVQFLGFAVGDMTLARQEQANLRAFAAQREDWEVRSL